MGSDGHGNLGSPKDKRESFEKIKEEGGFFLLAREMDWNRKGAQVGYISIQCHIQQRA